MTSCPVPHGPRDFFWLGAGLVGGALTALALSRTVSQHSKETPVVCSQCSSPCAPHAQEVDGNNVLGDDPLMTASCAKELDESYEQSKDATDTNTLGGRLYTYSQVDEPRQAFESPLVHSSSKFMVFIGGMAEGLLACPYVPFLAEMCESCGWALVQPLLTSSYRGYATSSLARDCEELTTLLKYLTQQRGMTQAVLVGHSTGSQDVVYFMKHTDAATRSLVAGCVLQAGISDREFASDEELQLLPRAEVRAVPIHSRVIRIHSTLI